MNALTTTDPVSAQTLEHVLGTGDLSKLTTAQRVEFYKAACHSLGLNPLTRPIRFLSFQGQMQAYFTRDGTDQLRKLHNISLHVVDQNVDAGLYVVRVQAKMPSGRSDEDIGAVVLPQSGESRANALMKATTKAKRRVTLSICGLGWSSEDELDTMPGAVTFDAEDEAPDARDTLNSSIPMTKQVPLTKPAKGDRFYREPPSQPPPEPKTAHPLDEHDGTKWLANFESLLVNAQSQDEVVEIAGHPSVGTAIAKAPAGVRARVSELLSDAYGRFPETADADADADASNEPASAA